MSKREFTLFLAIISIICLIVISFVVFKRLNTNNKESNENNPEEFSIYESSEYQRIISEPHELNFDQEYDKEYAYLVNDSGEIISNQDKIASYIFSDDISTESDYCRYIDTSSKKIGYMNTHAEIKIPAQYEEAEEMKGGFAVVSEDLDKGYFYIDQNENRLNSENYKFCDSFNDFLARVEKMDGSWSIITRDNRTVVENYDSINELPSCHSTLTGIKDQKAVILKLDMYDEIYETKILEDSDSISAPVFDCFAITRNNNGYGVVDIISGEQVIPNSYEKIEDRIIEDDGNWIRVKFICKNSKGEYEIIEKQF